MKKAKFYSVIPALVGGACLLAGSALSAAAEPQAVTSPRQLTSAVPSEQDLANAKSVLPLLTPEQAAAAAASRKPAVFSGPAGLEPGFVPGLAGQDAPGINPNAYGKRNHPFTTKRAYDPATSAGTTVALYPWGPTGKLTFLIGSSTYVCTASLIKKGLLVTAAHCTFNYGTNSTSGWYKSWTWYPARTLSGSNIVNPYGSFTAKTATIPTVYFKGTDVCATRGVSCDNDVAVITLNLTPGATLGYYGYGWNGYSTASYLSKTQAQITQLGYPQAIDGGNRMIRTDSLGFYTTNPKNMTIGSSQTGGSSGGPWLVNFGTTPAYGSGSTAPTSDNQLVVVGTTSWGYTDTTQMEQGASQFANNAAYPSGNTNIQALVAAACAATPAACQ